MLLNSPEKLSDSITFANLKEETNRSTKNKVEIVNARETVKDIEISKIQQKAKLPGELAYDQLHPSNCK